MYIVVHSLKTPPDKKHKEMKQTPLRSYRLTHRVYAAFDYEEHHCSDAEEVPCILEHFALNSVRQPFLLNSSSTALYLVFCSLVIESDESCKVFEDDVIYEGRANHM